MRKSSAHQNPPRIEYLRVRNYRALKDIELKALTPLSVFIGPNGSGKSTIFDVFAFLSECFTDGLRKAWDRRGRFKELRTRDAEGPISIEMKYKEAGWPTIGYKLVINETLRGPIVELEALQWRRRGNKGLPFQFLRFENGHGFAITGNEPDESAARDESTLASPELLAVNSLGQFERHARVKALREFITGWHLSYLSAQDPRGSPEAGPQEHLASKGENLANVIQYLREQHPAHLDHLLQRLTSRIPKLEKVEASILDDGRLLLRFKDQPFKKPILARYASDGTIKMLAYLVLIHDPRPPALIGIEEPENFLHPRLLTELAEECNLATKKSQIMMTTHSPFVLNALLPKQVRVLYRDRSGYTKSKIASDIEGLNEQLEAGGQLGDLWMQGYFGVGDPLAG